MNYISRLLVKNKKKKKSGYKYISMLEHLASMHEALCWHLWWFLIVHRTLPISHIHLKDYQCNHAQNKHDWPKSNQ
jgi:hypothetical protein